MSLRPAEQIAGDSSIIRSIEVKLEYTKRRSKLRDQASETSEATEYWESHKEKMAKRPLNDQDEDIEYTLLSIRTKYLEECTEFSPSRDRIIRTARLSPEPYDFLHPFKHILPHNPQSFPPYMLTF